MRRPVWRTILVVGMLLVLLPLVPTLAGQATALPGPVADSRLGPASYEVLMLSRQFTPPGGISTEDRQALETAGRQARAAGRERIHALVQLESIPTQAEKDAYARRGLVLLEYIPNYTWLAAVPSRDPAPRCPLARRPGPRRRYLDDPGDRPGCAGRPAGLFHLTKQNLRSIISAGRRCLTGPLQPARR